MGLFSRLFGAGDENLKQRIQNLETDLGVAHVRLVDMEAHLLELRNIVGILTMAQTQMGADMSEIYRALRAVVGGNVHDEDLFKTNPFVPDDDDDGYMN